MFNISISNTPSGILERTLRVLRDPNCCPFTKSDEQMMQN